MATTCIKGLTCREGKTVSITLRDCISYGKNKNKTMGGELVEYFNCSKENADSEMFITQKEYEYKTGKKVNRKYVDVKNNELKEAPIIYTLHQSFAHGEVEPHKALHIGIELANELLGDEFQYVVCTHTDKKHIHNHIYFNAVSIDATHKFNSTIKIARNIRTISDRICEDAGLSVIIPSNQKSNPNYSNTKEISFRHIIKNDIDNNLKLAKNYDDFLLKMSEDYLVVNTGKHLKMRHNSNGQQRFIRVYSLGENYSEESFKKYFTVNRVHSNKKIKISFAQKIKSKVKRNNEKNIDLTYSQKVRNIKAMFFTLKVISDFDISKNKKFDNATKDINQVQDTIQNQINVLNNKMNEVNSYLTSLAICNKYQDVFNKYQSSILKQKFATDNSDALLAYNLSKQKLDENNITISSATANKLQSMYDNFTDDISNLKDQMHHAEMKINSIFLAKDIVSKIHNNNSLLVDFYKSKEIEKHKSF